jgi:pantetheine-phosphate adenylyltransferase
VFSPESASRFVREEPAGPHPRKSIEIRRSRACSGTSPRRWGAKVIVRGLRALTDFEYEFQMTAMNQQLNREIETVFFMADVRHQAIASRLVKEIAKLGGDITPFVTPGVARRLKGKYAS